jgi:plasmid stability protein
MAQLVVLNLEDVVKARLRRRARRHWRSTEEEVRGILRNAVRDESGATKPLGRRLQERFVGIGSRTGCPSWAAKSRSRHCSGTRSGQAGGVSKDAIARKPSPGS